MLEVMKDQRQQPVKPIKEEDIIVTKYEEQTTYLKDGTKQIKRVPKKINVTKMVNERKKLVKQDTAQDKLAEIEKIFTK